MSADPHDQLLLQIRGAVAEYERTLIAERMRRGRQAKLRAGTLLPWTTAPFGYRLDPDQEIHALRMLRSMLHGFATLEAAGGFQIDAPVDDSFTWMINFIDHGLQATTATSGQQRPSPADAHRR